jgi:hypothetical protein
MKWYPSEYLFKQSEYRYCLMADKSEENFTTFGASFMKHNDYIFDLDNNKIGIARSKCSDDAYMIVSE